MAREKHSVDPATVESNVNSKYSGKEADMIYDFAIRFGKLLEEEDLHQMEFSKETGISQASISDYRNGKKEPSLCNLVTIAKHLNTDCDYLMTGTKADHIGIQDYTGLSDKSISTLHEHKEFAEILNRFLCEEDASSLLEDVRKADVFHEICSFLLSALEDGTEADSLLFTQVFLQIRDYADKLDEIKAKMVTLFDKVYHHKENISALQERMKNLSKTKLSEFFEQQREREVN